MGWKAGKQRSWRDENLGLLPGSLEKPLPTESVNGDARPKQSSEIKLDTVLANKTQLRLKGQRMQWSNHAYLALASTQDK